MLLHSLTHSLPNSPTGDPCRADQQAYGNTHKHDRGLHDVEQVHAAKHVGGSGQQRACLSQSQTVQPNRALARLLYNVQDHHCSHTAQLTTGTKGGIMHGPQIMITLLLTWPYSCTLLTGSH